MRRTILVVLLTLGCGGNGGGGAAPPTDAVETVNLVDQLDATDAVELPEPSVLWEPGAAIPECPALAAVVQYCFDPASYFSPWGYRAEESPSQPLDLMHHSDLAVGNGLVFSLVGYDGPFNRLHSMVGPGYERGDAFFGDVWLEVRNGDGPALQWQQEWLGRLKSAPIVVTQALQPVAGLTTFDAAPVRHTVSDPLPRAIIRLAIVKNRSAVMQAAFRLVARFARPQTAVAGGCFEEREGKRRTLLVSAAESFSVGEKELVIAVPSLDPGEEHVVELAFVMEAGPEEFDATAAALPWSKFGDLLAKVWARWGVRTGPLAEQQMPTVVRTPDEMVNGYLESQLLVVLSQQTEAGGVCPMSQYTHVWMRDAHGPLRHLLALGMFKDAKKLLDYLWYGTVTGGGIQNAYPADLDPMQPLPDQPDWASMGVMTGHLKAETPSFLPLMHYWYWKASGDLSFMPERLAMMKHALDKQAFELDDLLPFSGDETYRAAMAIAHGQELTQQFDPGFVSAYSSWLWVVGARALAEMCTVIGEDEMAADLVARAEKVRQRADAVFLRADGTYLPYATEEGLVPAAAPFEDVSMQPTWLRVLSPDDPVAVKNLEMAITLMGGEDGILVTPLPEQYKNVFGLPVTQGVYTGMNPGYYLWALAAAQHPLSEKAFNAMRQHATRTGTTPEYQILDDFLPLHLLFDETGAEPADYTARYRPWEGAINAEAVLFYLLGLRQDAVANRLSLAPHLPNGWSWLEAEGVRVGDARVDVRVERPNDSRWKVVLAAGDDSEKTPAIELALPLSDGSGTWSATVNGEPIELAVTQTAWGTRLGKVTGLVAPATLRVVR